VKGKWTSEGLEEAMETIEQDIYSLQGASWIFHIFLNFFSDHLNGRTWSKKMGPLGVLTREEDVVVYK
jgi:hypothetical protein